MSKSEVMQEGDAQTKAGAIVLVVMDAVLRVVGGGASLELHFDTGAELIAIGLGS